MKQLLEYIIPNIVNHPEDVVIEETKTEGEVSLTIKTHPEDIGRVIGKSGKVIKAIRQIARILAIKQGVRVNIDILDQRGEQVAPPTTTPEPETEGKPMPEEGIDLQELQSE